MKMTYFTKLAYMTFGLSILAISATAQEASGPGFGGPNAVENQVESDLGETWDAW